MNLKFEEFRPQLKSGRLTPQGEKIVFELDEPNLDQIILSVDMTDFLLLCTGEHTVGEIIEVLYRRKGTIKFKSIYRTLNYLSSRGFLENADSFSSELSNQEKDSCINNEFHFLTFRPLFEFSIGRRIVNDRERPLAFYAVSMLILIFAILSFQFFSSGWLNLPFLAPNGSYWHGLVFLFVAASILLSIKGVLKCFLLLLLTGRAYNFGFVFNWFAAYFRVRSDSLFLVGNKLYLTLFHTALALVYFPIVAFGYYLIPNLPAQSSAYALAFFLFLLELNPYQESEISDLFRSFFDDDTVNKLSHYFKPRPLFSLIHPFERNRDFNLYFFFTHFSLVWSGFILFLFARATEFHFGAMFSTLKHGAVLEREAVLILLSLLGTFGIGTLHNMLKIVLLAFVMPTSRLVMSAIRQYKSHKLEHYNPKEILGILESLPLFNYLTPELLGMIVDRSELKQYKRGSPVIIQGSEGAHLYVLLAGSMDVHKRSPIGRSKVVGDIQPISIFGEIAVIDESPATASVVAREDSVILEIPAITLRQVAGEVQYIRELESFRGAIMVNQFFSSAPVFRDLPETVVQMFITKGKIESFIKDEMLFRQGDYGDEFYLLLRGTVGVSVNGRSVSKIQQGGFFGEISMIADVPRTGSIIALEPVQVLKVTRDAFWEILAHDITIAMFIESIGEMRVREDIEILRNNGHGHKSNVA